MSDSGSARFRVMAIDYGTKRIGIAVSDELRMLASGRGVVMNGVRAIQEIVGMVVHEHVTRVILGIPLTLANSESAMTAEARRFGVALREALPSSVEMIHRDERLTSVMANGNIASQGLKKHRREEKSLRDEEAARIVLQEYLDEIRRD